jgi:hypothetical protein
MLHPNSLKFEYCKFNIIIIINIINITLRLSITARPKTFKYNFIEKPKTLKF